MKKLLVLAALSAMFSASADDLYFYWLVDSNATVSDPRTSAPAEKVKDKAQTGYATIKLADSGTYLNFYDSPGGVAYGSESEYRINSNPATPFDLNDNGPTFAGIISSEMDTGTKFLLELYNDDREWIGQTEFTYQQIQSYLTAGGMSTPTDAKSFGAFQSVPEPTSGMLLLLGVAGLALRRKNKKA